MKKKLKAILIPLGILLIIGIILIIYRNSTKIPRNQATAVGNTPGNLISGGLFCENDSKIYFANPYDNDRLYSMNLDCSDIKLISEDSVSYINSYGKYVYYVKNNAKVANDDILFRGEVYGVVRCKTDGKNYTSLHSGFCTDLSLTGNTLIYNSNRNSKMVTYSVDINGKGKGVVTENDYSNASVYDGKMYFSRPTQIDGNDHGIYELTLPNGAPISNYKANTYLATYINNKFYYIDLDNNYALTVYDIASKQTTVLTTDKVVSYNVYKDVIYYQEESYDHNLVRIKSDGSERTVIAQGDTTNVSCTSKYTFFKMAGTDTLYRTPTYGEVDVEKFTIE